MASSKRITGNYDIYANLVTIHGNLNVSGTRTEVNNQVVNETETITGNLTINGPLFAGGSKGTYGQTLTSNANGVFWSSLGASTAAAGNDRNIQFNTSGLLGGDNQLNYFANGNIQLGNTLISNTAILSSFGNNDIKLNAGGSGKVYIQDAMKLDFQSGATPTNIASTIHLLANTPGGGGTGLYFVNSSGPGELISKKKATVLAIIFS